MAPNAEGLSIRASMLLFHRLIYEEAVFDLVDGRQLAPIIYRSRARKSRLVSRHHRVQRAEKRRTRAKRLRRSHHRQ